MLRPVASVLAIVVAVATQAAHAEARQIIYVDAGATPGAGDGTSWALAYPSISLASSAANIYAATGVYSDIWIRKGFYRETVDLFAHAVGLYGGFNGTEILLEARNPKTNPTIIDTSGIAKNPAKSSGDPVISVHNTAEVRIAGLRVQDLSGTRSAIELTSLGAGCVLADCEIMNIDAGAAGGDPVICNRASVSIVNCMFDNNVGFNCGALNIISSTTVTLTQCRFSGNRSLNSAGAVLAASNSALQADGVLFEDNEATEMGGAIYFGSRGKTFVGNACIFLRNRAAKGGALAGIITSNGNINMTNCVLASNFATGAGGALYLNGTGDFPSFTTNGIGGTFANCTFHNNSGSPGGGIYHYSTGALTLANNIISACAAVAIYEARKPSAASIRNNLFSSNNGGDYFDFADATLIGAEAVNALADGAAGNRSADPAFRDVASNDYHLGESSAARSLADSSRAPDTDLDGNPRPGTDGAIDAGAFEFDGSPAGEGEGEGENHAPVANAGEDRTLPVTQPVQLDGGASSDEDGDSLSFHWTISSKPPNSLATINSASAFNANFTPDFPGTYIVRLFVSDGLADSAPDTVTIVATLPIASAGSDQTLDTGDTVQLDGSASVNDVENTPLRYAWTLLSRPLNSVAALQNAATASPSFTPDVPGTYIVQLIVNDGVIDSAPDTIAITVRSPGLDGVQAAQHLRANFGASDADQDGSLSYGEATYAIPSMNTIQFIELDANQDGLLTEAELTTFLNTYAPSACGCLGGGCSNGKRLSIEDLLGDLVVLAGAVSILLMRGRLPRI